MEIENYHQYQMRMLCPGSTLFMYAFFLSTVFNWVLLFFKKAKGIASVPLSV